MQNKVVFTQNELPSILLTQDDLPTMGVLHKVQWFSICNKNNVLQLLSHLDTRNACCLLYLKNERK